MRFRKYTPEQLQEAKKLRDAGADWSKVGKKIGSPVSTLRGAMIREGLLTRTGRTFKRGSKKGAAVIATAATSSTPAGNFVIIDEYDGTAVVTAEVTETPQPEVIAPGDLFVPPDWYGLLRYAVKNEKGATMFGPRGSGKSTAIRKLSEELGVPTVTLQCAANMQIDSLIGSWTSENGTMKWIDGALAIAVRTGSWMLAEEANVVHPGVWSAVNTLTDNTGEGLRLPNGEVIMPHPNFRLILLYNEGYAGTREVNAALKERLMPIYTGYLNEKDEIKILVNQTGATEEEATRVRSVAHMIRSANLRFDLSPRSLVRWIKVVKLEKMSWATAYEKVIIDLVGTPETAGPTRQLLAEIARNTVLQWRNDNADAANNPVDDGQPF